MRIAIRMAFAAALAATSFALPALAQVPATPVCATCHAAAHASIALTHHGAKNDANGSMCQACHGDATEHLKDPARKPENKMKRGTPAATKDSVCLMCHGANRHLAHWDSGKHAKNEVACVSCHNMHKPDPLQPAPHANTSRSIEADTCGTCHKQIRSATLKYSHHPITEGKMKCSDCHNPHGALTPMMLKHETVNQQCYSCHAEKRGPYLFGHPPVEENCLTCHNPHGSSHEKLLVEKAPHLCQDCHVTGSHPTSLYGSGQAWLAPDGSRNSSPSTRFVARGCLNCHNAIHGSNAPARGKTLTR